MPKTVLNNVQKCRLKEGLALAMLSRLSNLSERTIRKIENNTEVAPTTRNRVVNGFNAYDKKTRFYTFAELFPNDSDH